MYYYVSIVNCQCFGLFELVPAFQCAQRVGMQECSVNHYVCVLCMSTYIYIYTYDVYMRCVHYTYIYIFIYIILL